MVAVIIVAVETVYFTVVIVMIIKVFDCEARSLRRFADRKEKVYSPRKGGGIW